ncbi:acyltransferase family protein [Hyphomicrobium sp.]|uniref:acyltransferase family protein n=1 Tax=Hyphomicrobium sp. TaxID=82 RepID=UPI003F72AE2E
MRPEALLPMSTAGASSPYRPDIDGLRALSIVAVVLHHFDVPYFGGGFVGVDVFFVISGYLITSIVLPDVRKGTFSFARFYERRARRLLPSLAIVLCTTFLLAVLVMTPQDILVFCRSMFYALIFAANLFFAEQGGYFSASLENAPLLHTWSLAVEEQFYIVWPILLLTVSRFLPRWTLPITILLLALSFAAAVMLGDSQGSGAFFYPHTRIWELLAGCGLALSVPQARRVLPQGLLEAASVLGLGLILFAVFGYDDQTKFPGVATVAPVLGAALIIWSGVGNATRVGQALSWRPVVFVGLVSYAWYLWHWPLLVLYRYSVERDLTPPETIGLILLSFALAVVSWRYLEQPVRHGAFWKPRRFAVGSASAATAALVAMAASGYATEGFIARFPPAMQELTRKRLASRAKDKACPRQTAEAVDAGDLCRVWDAGPGAPSMLLWGDSHASVIRPMFRDLAEASKVSVTFVGTAACPPLIGIGRRRGKGPETCEKLNAAAARLLQKGGLRDVVLVARWNYYVVGHDTVAPVDSTQHYLRDAQSVEASLEENRAAIARSLAPTLAAIAASGARAWIVMEPPYAGYDVPNRMARALIRGETPDRLFAIEAEKHRQRSQFMREALAGLPVTIIEPADALCEGERCLAVADGKPLYFDDNHLSIYGTERLKPLFADVFATQRTEARPVAAP